MGNVSVKAAVPLAYLLPLLFILKHILLVIILYFHWSKMCRLFSVLPLSVTIILPQIFRSEFDWLDCKQTHQQPPLFQFLSISVFSQWILGHVVFKKKTYLQLPEVAEGVTESTRSETLYKHLNSSPVSGQHNTRSDLHSNTAAAAPWCVQVPALKKRKGELTVSSETFAEFTLCVCFFFVLPLISTSTKSSCLRFFFLFVCVAL